MAINPGHNSSVAVLSDGDLVYFMEEERLSRIKYDSSPLKSMTDAINKYCIDELVIGGTNKEKLPFDVWHGSSIYEHLVRKYNPGVNVSYLSHEHHLGHAAGAFYNSGFDESISIVVDGAGSFKNECLSKDINIDGFETESAWYFNHSNLNSTLLYKRYFSNDIRDRVVSQDNVLEFDNSVTIVKSYEAVSEYLGFHPIEAGKTMGLSSYGQHNDSIPNLFLNGYGDKNVIYPAYPRSAFLSVNKYPHLSKHNGNTDWHDDQSKVTQIQADLAWKVQRDTQKLVGDLIEESTKKTGVNNVCLSGGYALNCVANYYLKKRFPHVNLYVEPISSDAGTSIGLAKYWWRLNTKTDHKSRPLKSLYIGKTYGYDDYNHAIAKFKNDIIIHEKITPEYVAEIIANKNIIAIYQNESEAGPRALGNRSILYDPRDPNGKDHVNAIKGREWFRPFAGSIIKEHVNDWFDMAGLEESPFMMYAVDAKEKSINNVPSIIHVDNTCRIQTVTYDQNKNYHELIEKFYELTDVPILFNTSFNLAGEPLVETPDDAIRTLLKSGIEYLYMPTMNLLIEKKV